MIVLAVKPQVLGELLDSIKGEINDRALVSIAAGWTMDMLTNKVARNDRDAAACDAEYARAGGGLGMTGNLQARRRSPRLIWHMRRVFLMQLAKRRSLTRNCLTASLRSVAASPAYIFMLIEAMADAASSRRHSPPGCCQNGGTSGAWQCQNGAGNGEAPGQLKDEVCSPAGTTIEAEAMLEKRGFRAAVQDAMAVCAEKSRQMSK